MTLNRVAALGWPILVSATCAAAIGVAQDTGAGKITENKLKAFEYSTISAGRCARAYRVLLATIELSADDQQVVERRIFEMETRALNDEYCINGKWKSSRDLSQLSSKANQLIAEAIDLGHRNPSSEAREKLEDASELDPVGFHADFIQGLHLANMQHEFDDADAKFQKCVDRGEKFRVLLGPVGKINLRSALNNLALTKIRENKLQDAFRAFGDAMLDHPSSITAANLVRTQRYLELNGPSVLRASDALNKRFFDTARSLVEFASMDQIRKGWGYLGYLELPETQIVAADPMDSATNMKAASGTGVIVYPGFVLADCRLAMDGERVIRSFSLRCGERTAFGELIELDEQNDLALIHAPALAGMVMQVSSEKNVAGQRVQLFAHTCSAPSFAPALESFQCTLDPVSIAGSVELLPNIDGKPVPNDGILIDQNGNLVGLLVESIDERLISYSESTSAEQILAFLTEHIPSYSTRPERGINPGNSLEAQVATQIVQIDSLVPMSYDRLLGRRESDLKTIFAQVCDDRACLVCNGWREILCPNADCAKGDVAVSRGFTLTDPHGRVKSIQTSATANCPTCGGTGKINCPACSNGDEQVNLDSRK